METVISKSKFKPHALKFFREVEKTGREIIITDRGKPVLKVVPYYEEPSMILRSLRDTVVRFDDPFEPVGMSDWKAMK